MNLSLKEIIDSNKKSLKKSIFVVSILALLLIVFSFIFSKDKTLRGCLISFEILFIILLIKYIFSYVNFKSVKEEELDISSENIIFYSKDRYLITENYIFYLDEEFKKIKYDEILLMYKIITFKRLKKILVLVLSSGKKYYFHVDDIIGLIEEDIFDFSNIIQEKNKDVLVGKVYENEKIMDEKYGINMYSFPLNIMIRIRKLIKKK